MKEIHMSSRKRIKFLIISAISMIFFLILSYYVNKDIFRSWDYNTMVDSQNTIHRTFDLPFSLLTLSGSTEITFLILVSLFIYFYLKKKHIFTGLVLYFVIFAVELAGKLFIYHPKPPPFFNRYVLPISLPSSFIVHTNFSFPSGHMARSTFVVVIFFFLLMHLKMLKIRKYIFFFLLFVYLIGMIISRIYLGEHWFSDVMGGLLLGTGLSTLAFAFW